MVGDPTFAAAFDALGLTSWRIVNTQDLVPQLPSGLLGYKHIGVEQAYNFDRDSSSRIRRAGTRWRPISL